LLLGALAAMMSTADSVLLSLSSIVIQDIVVKTIGYSASDEKLLKLGKISSWVLMGIVVVVALQLQGITLFRLLVIKFDLLVQVAPAFILGLYLPRLGAGTALVGIAAGCAVAVAGFALDPKWAWVHPGTVGLGVNLFICVVGSFLFPSESFEQKP